MAPRKNPTEPTVTLTLGEETYTLFFSFEAVAEAEDLTGETLVLGLNTRNIRSPRVSFVRAMLYACLRPHHAAITLDQARTMVTQKTIQAVWGKVLDAWMSGMKEIPEEAAAGDPLKGQS